MCDVGVISIFDLFSTVGHFWCAFILLIRNKLINYPVFYQCLMLIFYCIPNSDVTAEEFVRIDEEGKTRHDKFKELLAKMLPAKLSDIIVFSVMNVDGKQTDVRFAVHDGSAYYRPEKLHAEMAAFKNEVCSLGLSV